MYNITRHCSILTGYLLNGAIGVLTQFNGTQWDPQWIMSKLHEFKNMNMCQVSIYVNSHF